MPLLEISTPIASPRLSFWSDIAERPCTPRTPPSPTPQCHGHARALDQPRWPDLGMEEGYESLPKFNPAVMSPTSPRWSPRWSAKSERYIGKVHGPRLAQPTVQRLPRTLSPCYLHSTWCYDAPWGSEAQQTDATSSDQICETPFGSEKTEEKFCTFAFDEKFMSNQTDPGSSTSSRMLNFARSHSRISFASSISSSSKGSGSSLFKSLSRMTTSLRLSSGFNSEGMGGERRIEFYEDKETVVTPAYVNLLKGGKPNRIRTARFTPMTWIPKSLFDQFQRIANVYFLCIVVMVSFPWSPKDWKSKVFPFCFVLLWTALKDLHEDSRRQRDDATENTQKVLRFSQKEGCDDEFIETPWEDVKVGDVLCIQRDKAFPADLVLLYAEGGHEAFISTISLDGETNLKERRAPNSKFMSELAGEILMANGSSGSSQNLTPHMSEKTIMKVRDLSLKMVHYMQKVKFMMKIGKPEVAVQDVKGYMSINGSGAHPISFHNFLPRGCVLRNTGWVLALAIFVGDDTKTRLNTARSKTKVSNMQKYLNICVWGLLQCLFGLCMYSATMSALQEDTFSLCCEETSWVIRFFIFTVTFYHVVPMSLYVCFEMLKLVLAYQVNTDVQMLDKETSEFAVARTVDLIEEMGQINFVFSDKTGTLTRNQMVFARACISGQDVGDFRATKGEEPNGEEPNGIRHCRLGLADPIHSDDLFWKDVLWFFTCLATCHSVQIAESRLAPPPTSPEDKKNGLEAPTSKISKSESQQGQYFGMSPDEVALVEAARDVGVVFAQRSRRGGRSSSTASQVSVSYPDGSVKEWTVMHELEFTSDRKRMSVIMRFGGIVFIVTKGADSVMEGLIAEPFSHEYKEYLKQYSQYGLRTLVVGARRISRSEYSKWSKAYKEAQNLTTAAKDARVAEVQEELERGLKMVGITAVEDCLQEGVPQAIATIKEAGIRLWVLTGDKTETAVDIANSCKLFDNDTMLAYVTEAANEEAALEMLKDAKRKLDLVDNAGLVLDGKTIQFCLLSEVCKQLIYELGIRCRSCVCSRLTPLQKRNLVDIIRQKDPLTLTLAIGDGANDVPMIEGAHLGIAVRGREGTQAVQVSDVAISQFRFLVPLFLCHGRRAYRRIALFLCYYLYKNVVLLMGDVVWMHMDRYRGRIAFPEYLSINYNVFFTSWHILFVLGFDTDVPDAIANSNPALYHVGPRRMLFNRLVFTRWILFAIYHGCAAWIVAAYWIIDGAEYNNQEPGVFWQGSITAFSIVIFVVMIKLLIACQSPFKFKSSILPTLGAVLCYVVILSCLAYVTPGPTLQPSMKGLPEDLLSNSGALIAMIVVPMAIITLDICYEVLQRTFFPSALDRLQLKLWRTGSA